MKVEPFNTIAESEAEVAKSPRDPSTMSLSELVALVLEHDPNFADNQSEEAVFAATYGDEGTGLRAHKKYRLYPKEEGGVRKFCIARYYREINKLRLSASAPAT